MALRVLLLLIITFARDQPIGRFFQLIPRKTTWNV
jgi:hypothetical protein